jgi:hypothetical protein
MGFSTGRGVVMRRPGLRFGLLIGIVVGLAAGGTFAWAAIPDTTTGAVTACYPTSGTTKGALRVIDYQSGQRCPAGQAMLTWPTRGFRWRGLWIGSTAYGVNDVVRYNGSAFIALKASTNVAPTNLTSWGLMATQGSQGPQGLSGPAGPPGVNDVHVLNLSVSGTSGSINVGSGCASSTPAGSPNCHQVYASGVTLTLAAQTNQALSRFDHWSGDCTGTIPTCTVTMNSSKNVTAVYVAQADPMNPAACGETNVVGAAPTITNVVVAPATLTVGSNASLSVSFDSPCGVAASGVPSDTARRLASAAGTYIGQCSTSLSGTVFQFTEPDIPSVDQADCGGGSGALEGSSADLTAGTWTHGTITVPFHVDSCTSGVKAIASVTIQDWANRTAYLDFANTQSSYPASVATCG